MARLRSLASLEFLEKLTNGLLSHRGGRRFNQGRRGVLLLGHTDNDVHLGLGNGYLHGCLETRFSLSGVLHNIERGYLQCQVRCSSRFDKEDTESGAISGKPRQEVAEADEFHPTPAVVDTDQQLDIENGGEKQDNDDVHSNSSLDGLTSSVQETIGEVLSVDSAEWELSDHCASATQPKSQILREVLATLNSINKNDDLTAKLAPFEGKISFQDATTVMKLLNDKQLCFSVYVWLKQQKSYTPDLTSLLTVIRLLAVANKWEKLIHVTQDLFEEGFTIYNGTYCRIIKAASLSSKIAVCEWWFQNMKEHGCWPDQTTYNTMIHAYALARMRDKSFAVFEEMIEMGIKPDINTFCHLLTACQRTEDPEGAQKVFLQIGDHELTADLITYSILLDTYGKLGRAPEAAALFKEMQHAGITPDAKAYNSLVHAYGKAGMMDEATSTFHEYLKLAGQNPDRVVFWTMLHQYCKAGLLKEALAVKRMMRVAQLPVDVSCYTNLIDGFRRKEQWEDAARAFKEMQRYKYPIGEATYVLMMKIYTKVGHHVNCERIFDQLMLKGYRHNVDVYEIMINIYKRINNITNAKRIYELMKRNNCSPSRDICNNMIHIFAKAGMLPACERIFKEMGSTGIEPNKGTFLSLIKAYAVYRDYVSAMDKYELMQGTGIKPDYELSELLVEVFLKNGQVEKAEKFMKEIVAAGIHPNKRMVAAVLRAGGVVELSKPLAVTRTQSLG